MATLIVGYVLIAVGQVISHGRLQPHALILVILGSSAALWAALGGATRIRPPSRPALVLSNLALLLSGLVYDPLTYCDRPSWRIAYRVGLLIVAGLTLTYLGSSAEHRWWARTRFILLLTIALAARIAVPLVSPEPGEDVFVVQQEAAAAALSGVDPYSVAYSQIFAPEVYEVFGYRSGFHYPPITLIPVIPSYGLLGDIRWAYVASELLLVFFLWWLIRKTWPSVERESGELVLWLWGFNSSVLFILEHSWTEPMGLVLLAGFILFWRCGLVWPAAVSLAAFFSFKQYTLLLFPLLFFLPRCGPLVACFAAISALSYLPWFLTNSQGIIASLMEPWKANARADGLSFAALWLSVRKYPLPEWVCPFFTLLGMHLATNRIVRSERGIVLALFVTLAFLFLTAKQSFCNYYYLLSFLVLVGSQLEASPPTGDDPSPRVEKPGSSTVAYDGSCGRPDVRREAWRHDQG